MGKVTLLEALVAMSRLHDSVPWVHNAGITDDIEALRKICLAYSDWNNNVYVPLMERYNRSTDN